MRTEGQVCNEHAEGKFIFVNVHDNCGGGLIAMRLLRLGMVLTCEQLDVWKTFRFLSCSP